MAQPPAKHIPAHLMRPEWSAKEHKKGKLLNSAAFPISHAPFTTCTKKTRRMAGMGNGAANLLEFVNLFVRRVVVHESRKVFLGNIKRGLKVGFVA